MHSLDTLVVAGLEMQAVVGAVAAPVATVKCLAILEEDRHGDRVPIPSIARTTSTCSGSARPSSSKKPRVQ